MIENANKVAKIKEITEEHILFNNGDVITFYHEQDCCEENYADFLNHDSDILNYEFQLPLRFEAVEEAGFRFGDSRRMYFIPCYSAQNGYYSWDIQILLNGKEMLDFGCEKQFY